MLLQWLMTGVLVTVCFAYAVKTLLPKVQQVKSGCGSCHGCAHAAQPSAAAEADFQPIVFHPRRQAHSSQEI
jgi:hypothetical protein